jgi:DNA-directed RNA polymerase subunit RPC12/RpoP
MLTCECTECGHEFTPPMVVDFACPECGSRKLKGRDTITVRVPTVGVVGIKIKDGTRKGKNRTETLDYTRKLSFFHNTQRWHDVQRTFDRNTDRYVELITDRESGELIRYVDEPLSKHLGHGSAKMSDPNENEKENVTISLTDSIGISTHVKGTVKIDDTVVGYSESLHDGRATSVSLASDGIITYGFTGDTPTNETGTLETCSYLVDAMNRAGAKWGCPTLMDDKDDADATCAPLDGGNDVLRIQVVRAKSDIAFWKRASLNDDTTVYATPTELVRELQSSITHKVSKLPEAQRRKLVLALSALHTAGYALGHVVKEFQETYGVWAQSQGFREIWLVGPDIEHTHRLA